jgi:hypothetical protein
LSPKPTAASPGSIPDLRCGSPSFPFSRQARPPVAEIPPRRFVRGRRGP